MKTTWWLFAACLILAAVSGSHSIRAEPHCEMVGPNAEEACRRAGEPSPPRDDDPRYTTTPYEDYGPEPTKTPEELSARCAEFYDDCLDDCTSTGNSRGQCQIGCTSRMRDNGCLAD